MAEELGLATIPVQHHHAHIASCMAEHSLDEKVIGISFDGTGLGDDNTIWGGEILLCDLEGYERFSHLEPIHLPGGDAATKNPWRTALSYLYRTYGEDFLDMELPFLKSIPRKEIELIVAAVKHRINSPVTTSMGRLFDAVSALTGTCTHSLFHAEAPMRLEQLVLKDVDERYPTGRMKPVETGPLIEKIVEDILENTDRRLIATKFHNTIIDVIFASAQLARQERGIEKVVLSGGTFQNRYLLTKAEIKLTREGFKVYSQEKVPSNDGGIALGQLAIAARRRKKQKGKKCV
jgi:hydrogenase maturation protein HypF